MNIDKFGHHVHKRLRYSEFTDTLHDALLKSETGDYDLRSSRLKGLLPPQEDNEAVNKVYLDKEIEDLKREIKKVSIDVKVFLKNLEKGTSNTMSSLYYTKTEIDFLLKQKST